MVPSVRSVGGAQNGIFCCAGIFWRMCGEIQQCRTVLPGHGEYDSEDQREVHPGEETIVQIIFRLELRARRFTSPCAVADFGEEEPDSSSRQSASATGRGGLGE